MANSLLIESDSLLAIREIERGQKSFSEWKGIISDIIRYSQLHVISRFSHIRRTSNGFAHNMAKIPTRIGDYKAWRRFAP